MASELPLGVQEYASLGQPPSTATMATTSTPAHPQPPSNSHVSSTTTSTTNLAKRLTSHRAHQGLTVIDTEADGCEIGWSHLVHAEIISVTSAMRRNSRWSGMSVSGLSMGSLGMNMGLRGREYQKEGSYRNQESPLMMGFNNLRSQLSSTGGKWTMIIFAIDSRSTT
ncbi:hypothetical protein BGZ73_002893 [Actinomortierella ambigua]|nr:hypothetical protein BGZ73_002893 [Actinomortierella ambigua]